MEKEQNTGSPQRRDSTSCNAFSSVSDPEYFAFAISFCTFNKAYWLLKAIAINATYSFYRKTI